MKRELGGRVYSNIADDSWVYTGPPPSPPPSPPPPPPAPPILSHPRPPSAAMRFYSWRRRAVLSHAVSVVLASSANVHCCGWPLLE
eukprot:8673693-Pyramimonas_sp.AAC.1